MVCTITVYFTKRNDLCLIDVSSIHCSIVICLPASDSALSQFAND